MFAFSQRHVLRNKFLPVFSIIISPALNRRQFAWPVTVTGNNRCGPFQRCSAPWVFDRQLSATENGIEEVNDKYDLQEKYNNGSHRNKLIQACKVLERFKIFDAVITTRYPGHACVVHWPENGISPENGTPEVNFTQRFVHVAAEHFREPVVNPCKHAEERRNTHYNVKVRYHEIGIVHLYIDGRVAQENTR